MKRKYLYTCVLVVSFLLAGIQPAFAQDEPVAEKPLLNEELQILLGEAQMLGTISLSDSGWSDPAVGTWDPVSKTGTLTTNVSEGIQIQSDGITLAGAGHTVAGLGSGYGVYLSGRTGVTVKNLNVQGFFFGFSINHSNATTLIGNTSSNNSSYGFNITYSNATTLIGNASSNNLLGIWFWRSHNCTLTDNIFSNNTYYGIYVSNSDNCILTGNTAELNYRYGIRIFYSDYCVLTGNTVEWNTGQGISLYHSDYCTLTGNTSSNNSIHGIFLGYSSNCALTDNVTSNNSYSGISVQISSNCTLTGNTCSNNPYGIQLFWSSQSQIYNNNFIDNGTQAYVYGGSGNVFNLPAPEGGNYWSNWTCPDADGDGFVDYPYIFPGGRDNLPLIPEGGCITEPPVADAGPDQTVLVNESAIFDGSLSYDPDGTIVSYNWDFGDAIQESGVIVIHAYNTAGTYIITFTVTDDVGAVDIDTATVTVLTPAQAINWLIGIVKGMNLQQGIENSFDMKLEAVQDALVAANAGVREDAVNKLEAFINAVEAQRGKVLTEEQADDLRSLANRIISVL